MKQQSKPFGWRSLAVVLGGFGIAVALVAWNDSIGDAADGDPIVVTLASTVVEPVTLAIPPAYFGHRDLAYVRETMQGGKQDWIMLSVAYPSGEPFDEQEGQAEMILTIHVAPPGIVRGQWVDLHSQFYGKYIGELHGLAVYGMTVGGFPEDVGEVQDIELSRAYYQRYNDDIYDILITCIGGGIEHTLCRLRWQTKNNIYFTITVPKYDFSNWEDYRDFADIVITTYIEPVNQDNGGLQ